MILWRHLDAEKQHWVYHANRADAECCLNEMAKQDGGNDSSRKFYRHQRRLGRVDIIERTGKVSMANMMNKIERGEPVRWLR